jgi:hypothetical protein
MKEKRLQRTGKWLGLIGLGMIVTGLTAWGALALMYHAGVAPAAVYGIAGLLTLGALGVRRWRGHALAGFGVAVLTLLLWWSTLAPSNDRDWRAEEAVLPYATFNGPLVTVHNIRNFNYRGETDFDVAYYDKTFNLDQLRGVDMATVYWMGPAIAHVFLSFDFGDNKPLAISIEVRKEKGEEYSTLKGFFRQYELFYVVADERDVVRVRTNYRRNPPEAVYLYRLTGPVGNARRLFVEYMKRINAVASQPEWYNALTTNCTTNIWKISHVNPNRLPLSWKVLASGYVPEYLYENQRLDNSLSFAELQRASLVNPRAQAADRAADFSRRIRVGLPGMGEETAR